MSRASIFDLLHERQPVSEPEPEPQPADYDCERLKVLDGLALTAAGLITLDSLPEAHTPELSSSLFGADDYRLLVHEIADLPDAEEPVLERMDTKALRLLRLLHSVVIEALMLLETLPEDAHYDVVLSAPVASKEAANIITDRLRAVIAETRYGERLAGLRHTTASEDPHTLLDVSGEGGMPDVLWLSVDTVINQRDLASPASGQLLVQSSRGEGLHAGEAAAALLIRRLANGEPQPEEGWLLGPGMVREHAARSALRNHQKCQALIELLGEFWSEEDVAGTPSRLVVDARGLPGRAVELGRAVTERWPEIDTIDDGVSVEDFCGWPGASVTALMLVLAIAEMKPEEHAIILALHAEHQSRVWALRGPAGEASENREDHS